MSPLATRPSRWHIYTNHVIQIGHPACSRVLICVSLREVVPPYPLGFLCPCFCFLSDFQDVFAARFTHKDYRAINDQAFCCLLSDLRVRPLECFEELVLDLDLVVRCLLPMPNLSQFVRQFLTNLVNWEFFYFIPKQNGHCRNRF